MSGTRARRATVVLLSLLALLALRPAAAAQSEEAGTAEALVARIRQQLGEVDRALQEAADADAVEGQLERARRAHLDAIRDIEALIKQIKYRQSGQGGGASPQPKGGGGGSGADPKAPPRQNDEQDAPQPGSNQPQPQSPAEGDGQEQTPDGADPQGGRPDGSPPSQGDGRQPPPSETSRFTREDTDARWGLLPPKMQERLMNLHVDDVPERYRAWMDAYVRELNRLEQAGRP